jgi:hypothetical protein
MERNSLTECWVGLVLVSPAEAIYGTSVRCISMARLATQLDAQLAHRFQERQRLDVAHRAADFDNGHIGITGTLAHDALLDGIGDMRDDLNGAPR